MFVLSLLWKLLFFIASYMVTQIEGILKTTLTANSYSDGAILVDLQWADRKSVEGGKISFLSTQNKASDWQTSGLARNPKHPHFSTELSVGIKLIKRDI